MANFCMSCGASVEPTAMFCQLCGQALEQEQPEIRHGIHLEEQPIEHPAQQQYQPPPIQPEMQQYQQQYPYPLQPEVPQYQQQYPYPLQLEVPQYQQQHPYPLQPEVPQYQQQYPYPQHPYQQTTAKKRSKLPLFLGIAGGIVVIITVTVVLLLSSAIGALNNMAKTNYYEIGSDEVASVKLALGEERTVVGISTSSGGGVTMKEITFSVDGSDQNEDMITYMNYLREEEDFLLVTDVDFSGPEGEGALGRNSIDEGYSILVQLEYDDTGYVITLIRQKGEIEIIDKPDSDSGQVAVPGSTSSPEPNPEPSPDPSPESSPESSPGPSPEPKPVIVAESALEIFDSGCFHMIAAFDLEDEGSFEMETYMKGSNVALITRFDDMATIMIVKDGKVYYIIDELKMVYLYDMDPEEVMPEYGSATMSYIGEGSGEFNGKTYHYSEYAEADGGRSFYFMDGSSLVGIRVIGTDGSIFDMTILALDSNVPDDVFSWPSDYEVTGPFE